MVRFSRDLESGGAPSKRPYFKMKMREMKMRGSLRCAADDENVRYSGREDDIAGPETRLSAAAGSSSMAMALIMA